MSSLNKNIKVINPNNPHPSHINKKTKSTRLPVRRANDFPVGENVKCTLSSATAMITNTGERVIAIHHMVQVPDIRLGKEGNYVKRYFEDWYFFPKVAGNDKVSSSHSERLIYRFVSFVGGENKVKDGGNLQEFIDSSVEQLNNNSGKEYYLKTILKLNKHSNTLYLQRGNFPYYSDKPNLKYADGEDFAHSYVVYGEHRLKELTNK